ncbi:capsid assembly protein [Martelella mangrovi]|uniref:Capsid assembly protein n=1 Tax=Martelella mangrovi TaxID=1397477 RepID=A0ABV2IE09_9HYPH
METSEGTQAPEAPQETAAAERPAWLPEKFNSPEDFAASYAELERKQSAGAAAPQPVSGAEAQATPEAAKELGNSLEAKGLNIADFYAEYAEHGSLSEESYKKLEEAGRPRAEIDSFIQGQEALMAQQTASIYAEVGGEAKFKAIQQWARATLSPREIEAYNRITESGTFEALRLAVQGMASRYQAANGSEPQLVGGESAGHAEGFGSKQEVIEAMKDPRYRKDPAYQKQVYEKLRAGSPFRP